MSRKYPCVPKGRACRVDLTDEYKQGQLSKEGEKNPYDPWDTYEEWYAWDVGSQEKHKL